MKYLANREEMKRIDGYTIERIGIPSIVLMERAAMTAVAVMLEDVSRNDRILAVCGTGNNGGDGAAMARILKINGFQVDVLVMGDKTKATEETLRQIRIAKNIGVNVVDKAEVRDYTIIIDAIFGIGLTRDVTGECCEMVEAINRARDGGRCKVYAVDTPTGVNADNGKVMKVAVKADCTVTFGVGKMGLTLYPGCEYAGEVVVADIGFPNEALEAAEMRAFIYERKDVGRLLPKRTAYSNKGDYGKALIVAGSKNMSGACYLSAKAAYRSGAGLVQVLTVEENREVMQTELPEAVLTTYEPSKLMEEGEFEPVLRDIDRASVVVIGPGMGTSEASGRILDVVLRHANVPVVVDADAINILAGRGDLAKSPHLGKNVILTPHIKEMARLCQCQTSDVTSDVTEFAKRFMKGKEFTLVLKDTRTLVLNGEHTYVNVSGNHGMATGGTGDVLTGILAGLVAGGKEPFEAATLGTYLHGLAGDFARDERNPYSLMAGDVVEALSYVMKRESLHGNYNRRKI